MDDLDIRTRAHDVPLFKIDIPKNEPFKRSVQYAGALPKTNLDKDIRNIDSFYTFKLRQKLNRIPI